MSKQILLFLIGLSSGFIVSAGIFAFITMIGIIPRLASRTKTANHIRCYENAILFGTVLANVFYIYEVSIPVGLLGLAIMGICYGMFVGCLALALAEVLDVIPIFSMRIRLKRGIPFIIASLALGKLFGAWYQMVIK